MNRREVLGGGAGLAAAMAGAGRAGAAVGGAFVNSIALEGERVWMAAKLGEAGPFYFAVDTGAEFSMIDYGLADRLKLKVVGTMQMAGVGGARAAEWLRAPEVRLASGIRFPDMLFAGIGAAASIGRDAAGLFGCGMFTTFDSDLDFQQGQWRVYTHGRGDFAGLQRLPSRFLKVTGGRQIVARVAVDGFEGEFVVDTGAPGELFLGASATRRSGWWSDERPYAPVRSGGVGPASVRGRAVRLGRMKLGPFVYERPLVVLSRGFGGSLEVDGLVGLATLARLNLTADVRNQALWATPNALSPSRGSYAKTGMLIERRNDRWIVEEVGTGSPAASAGLSAGDELVGVSAETIGRLRSHKAGAPELLTLEREGKRRAVTVTPADYL